MIKSLTSLRGGFILFIFFHHCMNLYPGGGSMAVTFFFVLGGFSMTIGYKDRLLNPDFNYRQYITRRCIRFFPLHWLCLFLALPFVIMSFSWLDIPTFILNSLLLQTWVPIKSFYFSFNQVSWYLADTMFFAVMFPFLGKWIIKANRNKRSLIAIFFVTLYTMVAIFLPVDLYHAVLYISPYMRLVDFVFGIFLALGYFSLREKPAKRFTNSALSQFIIICLIVLLVVESCVYENARCFSVIYWPLIALLILIASLSETSSGEGRFMENSYLQRLGDLSFVIFLTHQLVLRYVEFVFNRIMHFESVIIYVVITLILTLLLSIIIDKYFIKPVTQWLSKKKLLSMTVQS